MANSTSAPRRRNHQAAKPYSGFPLTAHPSGRWCKKIFGRLHYFGPIADWEGALREWERQRVDLLAGRTPAALTAAEPVRCTVRELCNRFLTAKEGKIKFRSWKDYDRTIVRILEHMGREIPLASLTSDDFDRFFASFPVRWGEIRKSNEVQRTRAIFAYAWAIRETIGLHKPINFGPNFIKMTATEIANHIKKKRRQNGPRMFSAEQIRQILEAAGTQLRAIVLLGINAAVGQEDIGQIPINAVDLERGWFDFPRTKNNHDRRSKLWPETVAALREWLTERKAPQDTAVQPLLFVTVRGNAWTSNKYGATAVTQAFDKILESLKMKQKGVAFYALRRTFRTVASNTPDRAACDLVMGHSDNSIAGRHYIESFDDKRLEALAEYVRNWLFAKAEGGAA